MLLLDFSVGIQGLPGKLANGNTGGVEFAHGRLPKCPIMIRIRLLQIVGRHKDLSTDLLSKTFQLLKLNVLIVNITPVNSGS
jgi:hypothetical protein